MESFSSIVEELLASVSDDLSESWSTSPLLLVLGTIGGLAVASTVFSFLRLVASLAVLPGKSVKQFGTPGVSWAIVTGPTEGLGYQFTQELAKAGYNLFLLSRSAEKLGNLSDELSKAFPSLKFKSYAIDFSSAKPAQYSDIQKMVNECGDIGVLVNNVGKSHDIPVTFAQTPEKEMESIVEINVRATLKVTSMVVPGMVQRKRGLILTMGSFAGLVPTPLLATYSGSKAFLQHWSSALGSELAPHGITVELVQSYLITGAMSKIRRSSALVPTPKDYVTAVMRRIGRSGGAQRFAYTSTPYWGHAIIQWALGTFVGFTGNLPVWRNRIMHEAVRNRALKKAERERGKKGL